MGADRGVLQEEPRLKKKQPKEPKKQPARRPEGEKKRESEDIERAVYDGMQDLRAAKKPGRA
jgi:hypothetical protein